MSRSIRLSLALAALVLATSRLSAQLVPRSWNNRTMTGVSLEIMTFDGAGLMMAALRTTHIGNGIVSPDFTLGLGYTSGVLVSTIDIGLGGSLGGQSGVVALSAGPSLLGAIAVGDGGSGLGAVVGLHGRASVIFPISDRIGVRFDAGRRYYFGNGESLGLWIFGFGVTGLGTHRPNVQR